MNNKYRLEDLKLDFGTSFRRTSNSVSKLGKTVTDKLTLKNDTGRPVDFSPNDIIFGGLLDFIGFQSDSKKGCNDIEQYSEEYKKTMSKSTMPNKPFSDFGLVLSFTPNEQTIFTRKEYSGSCIPDESKIKIKNATKKKGEKCYKHKHCIGPNVYCKKSFKHKYVSGVCSEKEPPGLGVSCNKTDDCKPNLVCINKKCSKKTDRVPIRPMRSNVRLNSFR